MVKVIRGERIGRAGKLAVGCSAAVINQAQQILLIKRQDDGRWAVPGGYTEAGESLTEACEREVREETGLTVKVRRLVSVYTNPHLLLEYADGNRLQLVVLHFAAEPVEGRLRTSDESVEVVYFDRVKTEALDMSRLDRLRVSDAFEKALPALIYDSF